MIPRGITLLRLALVWHSPKETRKKGLGPAAKLITVQYKCLRAITRAYEATNTKVLEAEAGVLPLDTDFDRTVLQSGNLRCAEVIRNKRGRRELVTAETTVLSIELRKPVFLFQLENPDMLNVTDCSLQT